MVLVAAAVGVACFLVDESERQKLWEQLGTTRPFGKEAERRPRSASAAGSCWLDASIQSLSFIFESY